jgi:hypothetical protein
MHVHYEISQKRSTEGHLRLTAEQEHDYKKARTDEQRKAAVRAAILAHADETDDWAYDDLLTLSAVPDDADHPLLVEADKLRTGRLVRREERLRTALLSGGLSEEDELRLSATRAVLSDRGEILEDCPGLPDIEHLDWA